MPSLNFVSDATGQLSGGFSTSGRLHYSGTIPEDLEGTLLRNGPGLFEIGGIPVSQPFDGDGMVSSLGCPCALR